MTQAGQPEASEDDQLLKIQLSQLQEELEGFYLVNRSLNRQLQLTGHRIDDQVNRHQARENRLREEEIERLRHHVDELHVELEMTREVVAALRASLSWKFTAPFRSIFGVFRSGK